MRKKGVVILLLASALAGVAMYSLYARQATYTLCGTEIITTTAPPNQISTILHQAAWEMGDCVTREDGGKHFPSFHQGAKSWKDDAGNVIAHRGITEFDDKNGNHCVIEDIAIPGEPRIILLKSDPEGGTMELANELMRQFHPFKIKPKG